MIEGASSVPGHLGTNRSTTEKHSAITKMLVNRNFGNLVRVHYFGTLLGVPGFVGIEGGPSLLSGIGLEFCPALALWPTAAWRLASPVPDLT